MEIGNSSPDRARDTQSPAENFDRSRRSLGGIFQNKRIQRGAGLMRTSIDENALGNTGNEKDRRKLTRLFPEDTDVRIEVRLFDGTLWPATVVDESCDGMCVLLELEAPVVFSRPLEVIYRSQPMICQITNITRHATHQRVGCKWG